MLGEAELKVMGSRSEWGWEQRSGHLWLAACRCLGCIRRELVPRQVPMPRTNAGSGKRHKRQPFTNATAALAELLVSQPQQ